MKNTIRSELQQQEIPDQEMEFYLDTALPAGKLCVGNGTEAQISTESMEKILKQQGTFIKKIRRNKKDIL